MGLRAIACEIYMNYKLPNCVKFTCIQALYRGEWGAVELAILESIREFRVIWHGCELTLMVVYAITDEFFNLHVNLHIHIKDLKEFDLSVSSDAEKTTNKIV